MELNKKEKLIWELSTKIELPDPPDKNEVWERLAQSIETLDDQLKPAQDAGMFSLPEWKVQVQSIFNLKGVLSFAFALVLIFPILYNSFARNTIITHAAENKTLQLADGSKVVLNSDSKIIFDEDYNIDNRSIKLEGEAYFDIVKGDIPFIVDTQHGRITVLGTIFNVHARNNGFEVGVSQGNVKVSNATLDLQLREGQLISVSSNFSIGDISEIYYEDYPDWINQKFYCDHTSLSDLCAEIERTFNIKIKFSKPSLQEITVSGVIDASDLETVLHTVSLLTQHEFKLEGDTCTII